MKSLEIRSARPEDRASWFALRRALWPGDEADHAREIEAHLARTDERWPQEALLAFLDGEPVGLAEVSVRPYAEGCETRDVGYLEGWFVTEAARQGGVGRALIEAAEAWAREQGCVEMASDAEPENEGSLAAHLACGFRDAGLVRCFAKRL